MKKSLFETNPELEHEWNYKKNNQQHIFPNQLSKGSDKKVWWICSNGHEWEASVGNRAKLHRGCPFCSGRLPIVGENDLATLHPELVKEWNYEKNGDLMPQRIKPRVATKVWWKCNKCGFEWQASVSNRTRCNPTGCPKCAKESQTSFPEQAVWFFLQRDLNEHVENRYLIIQNKEKIEIDIYIPKIKIGIEYDGRYWHRNSTNKDQKKNDSLAKLGIKIINICESDRNEVIFQRINYNYRNNSIKNLNWAISETEKLLGIIPCDIDVEKYESKIMEYYKSLQKKNSLATLYPELCKEWNKEKNGIITPEMFTPHSGKKVWWICSLGHEWKSSIDKRTLRNEGCPYCSGHRVLNGFNDLATVHPNLLKEWNYEKNSSHSPNRISPASHLKVWWRCIKGHEWQAVVSSRTSKKPVGCPVCANKMIIAGENDIATTANFLLVEWNYDKNNALGKKPTEMGVGTSQKVWWKCKFCGKEWMTSVCNKYKSGEGCASCNRKRSANNRSKPTKGNSLADKRPDIAEEFHETKNGNLTAYDVGVSSNKKVWWKCKFCGMEWKTSVANRTQRKTPLNRCGHRNIKYYRE